MDVYLFVMLYLAIGLLVSVSTYARAMKYRPTPHIFSVEDRAVMALTSTLVGLVWILFMPVLLVRWIWLGCRWIERMWNELLSRLPKVARKPT